MKNNPNWRRSIVSCVLVAALSKAVFDLPFFKVFFALLLIYATQVLLAEKEMKDGVEKIWTWLSEKLPMALKGFALFLVLRIIVGAVLGLPPIESYQAWKSGGARGLLTGLNTSEVLLFEVLFACVAGGLTSAYVHKSARVIINVTLIVALAVVMFRRGLPGYTASLPNQEEVEVTMKRHGSIGGSLVHVWGVAFGFPPTNTPPTRQQQQAPEVVVKKVVQLPDQVTPCTIDITEIRDIYTDGEPVWILPPEWPESRAIYYSGKGHLVIQGGDIHAGEWKFWSATAKNNAVLIRVIAVR
jgi:hypothetical protein